MCVWEFAVSKRRLFSYATINKYTQTADTFRLHTWGLLCAVTWPQENCKCWQHLSCIWWYWYDKWKTSRWSDFRSINTHKSGLVWKVKKMPLLHWDLSTSWAHFLTTTYRKAGRTCLTTGALGRSNLAEKTLFQTITPQKIWLTEISLTVPHLQLPSLTVEDEYNIQGSKATQAQKCL